MKPLHWLVLALALPAVAELRPEDATPLGYRLPLVLIHGWNASPETFDSFVLQLGRHEAARRVKVYRFGYDWSRSVATSAARLRADLAAQPELSGRPVLLIGHSMGGLVARGYAESRQPGSDGLERIGLLATLATPHHGSPVANLEWLGGDSRFSLLAKLVPTGLFELLDRLPTFGAVRTEGGHNLGWDNFDGSMPDDLWAGADRYLERLNRDLATHPRRDELLLRYRLLAAYTAGVPPLSLPELTGQVRRGDHYGAGCAMLAHGFRDGQGRTIARWSLNDGIVPLESALFLRPGPALVERVDDKLAFHFEQIGQRLQRPGIDTLLVQGVDHTGAARDEKMVAAVLDEVARYEPNLLVVAVDGQLVAHRPGGAAAAIAALPGDAIGATSATRLVYRDGDSIAALTPEGSTIIARGGGMDQAVFSPDARYAVLPTGDLVGCARPAWRPLEAQQAVWSNDSARVAGVGPDGRLRIATVADLGLLIGPALRPLAFAHGGDSLLATPDGTARIAPRPGSTDFAIAPEAAGVFRVAAVSVDGLPGDTISVTSQAPRSLWLVQGGRATALGSEASAPAWSPSGNTLAWIEGQGTSTLAVWHRNETARFELGGLASAPLVIGDQQILLAAAGEATRLLCYDGTAALRELARATARPNGLPPRLSPDGRLVAVPLEQGVLVAALDGSWRQELPGRAPTWLPTPAAECWTARGAPQP